MYLEKYIDTLTNELYFLHEELKQKALSIETIFKVVSATFLLVCFFMSKREHL